MKYKFHNIYLIPTSSDEIHCTANKVKIKLRVSERRYTHSYYGAIDASHISLDIARNSPP